MTHSTYDKFPVVTVSEDASLCHVGWDAIGAHINALLVSKLNDQKRAADESLTARQIICVECYPGVFVEQIKAALGNQLSSAHIIDVAAYYKHPHEIELFCAPYLGGDDPVFGRMNDLQIEDFFDSDKLQIARQQLAETQGKSIVVIGTGASLFALEYDLLIYADLARWEIQMRQRRGEIANLGALNFDEKPSLKYKRAFFIDWRAADRLKKALLPRIDLLLDTHERDTPKTIDGADLRSGLRQTTSRPFRVVPFFDPGVWGGHWMERVCDLPKDKPNHAWCFDCVPEENSLLLGFGDERVEIPSINLVFSHPRKLLGDAVYARFGAEFPIRFDFLDTMGGGNLSLQVHPLTGYIQEHFGMHYTQDESYYILDAGDDAVVYLGLKENSDYESMVEDLRRAQRDANAPFPDEKYVNKWTAKKHDHFLIPAGTIHCSGKNSMVLEISATPYIFTFKLWDWGRTGLDGNPRPIHLFHGAANIQRDITTAWVKENLINRFEPLAHGEGWREERTGLHEREFIETRRHWFTGLVPHDTQGGVNVLNLVEGDEAIVESLTSAFNPFVVHYAETFIVPASVGRYTIRPFGKAEGKECATLKAYVRT